MTELLWLRRLQQGRCRLAWQWACLARLSPPPPAAVQRHVAACAAAAADLLVHASAQPSVAHAARTANLLLQLLVECATDLDLRCPVVVSRTEASAGHRRCHLCRCRHPSLDRVADAASAAAALSLSPTVVAATAAMLAPCRSASVLHPPAQQRAQRGALAGPRPVRQRLAQGIAAPPRPAAAQPMLGEHAMCQRDPAQTAPGALV